ncbi:MAG TPA: cation acetate symporter [Pirellulales bacterium]
MIYSPAPLAVTVFALFVGLTLALSFYFARQTRSSSGYFAAGGSIHWFVNGVAFAGDYLSAASFLGICGMIASYGYDGFLYSIGYLAGWIVALLVIAEPLKRLGRYTFADALDSRFQSRAIKLSAGVSTLAVSLFYLIPQMVGAGALVKPLLGLPHWVGVSMVGAVVMLIVVTAGMVSTTYVQFLKGALLVVFSAVLTILILNRGFTTEPASPGYRAPRMTNSVQNGTPLTAEALGLTGSGILPAEGPWLKSPYLRTKDAQTGIVTVWRQMRIDDEQSRYYETQTLTKTPDDRELVNGLPHGAGPGETDFFPVGNITRLPEREKATGPLGLIKFFSTLEESEIMLWTKDPAKIVEADGTTTTIYYPQLTAGSDVLLPGKSPTFSGIRGSALGPKLNFISLMLALFGGTASLPHILIRYYTVKDQTAARKSTVVGIATIGFFYLLTLFMGLGAMTSGVIDVTSANNNMAAPLLAKSFGELLFAMISAIAFTTVLGTVSGLIVAASGAVVHDLLTSVGRMQMTDHEKVRAGKWAAAVVGLLAIGLGIVFEQMNVSFLVGWAFSVAASANLPSLVMLLFWKKTTKQGITAAILVGMTSSLTWILLSGDTYRDVYGLPPASAWAPFSQPGIVTIPLGFLVLIVVSLFTQPRSGGAIRQTT